MTLEALCGSSRCIRQCYLFRIIIVLFFSRPQSPRKYGYVVRYFRTTVPVSSIHSTGERRCSVQSSSSTLVQVAFLSVPIGVVHALHGHNSHRIARQALRPRHEIIRRRSSARLHFHARRRAPGHQSSSIPHPVVDSRPRRWSCPPCTLFVVAGVSSLRKGTRDIARRKHKNGFASRG